MWAYQEWALRQGSRSLWADPARSSTRDGLAPLRTALTFVFSWLVLTPIAIIISGKLLSVILKWPGQTNQRLQIKVPGILTLNATKGEAVFGFTAFLVNFVLIAVIGGPHAYHFFVDRFGPDPGQFDALCALGAFSSVLTSLFLVGATRGLARVRVKSDPILQEHRSLIAKLAETPDSADEDGPQ